MAKVLRRPTIISPTGHIQSYNFLRFLALIFAGCLLSFVGGYVNTVCIVSFFQIPVSAVTGATSKMVIELAQGNLGTTLHFFLLIFSFILGSFTSAALAGGSSFRIDRSYGLVLLLESFALALGYLCEKITWDFTGSSESLQVGVYWMSLACGLQNGICTTFSGAVIRTTHVTGILTDIGLILGQAIFYPRTRKHIWKLKVLVPLYGAFCLGGTVGYLVYQWLLIKAILLPCVVIGIFGITHLCYGKIFLLYKARHANKKPCKRTNAKAVSVPRVEVEWHVNNDSSKQIDIQNIP